MEMPIRKTIKLTSACFRQLKNELDELITIGRKLIADKLEQYRSDDNTEENVAYSQVLEEKQFLEERIRELERMLERAQIAPEKCDLDKVSLGCTVVVSRNGRKQSYTIVPSLEADPGSGKISEVSPMGKALVGRKVGEKITVNTPGAQCTCKVIEIKAR